MSVGRAAATLALGLALGACGGAQRAPLEVYAASSLRDALLELAAEWRAAGGQPLALNFGPSGGLARQILAARRADLFLSAGELEMDRVEQAGLLVEGTRRTLASNRLVVIEPAARESLFGAFAPRDLLDPALAHISLGDPDAVPAGRYAREWLEAEGLWQALAPRVARAVDVRAALAAVESGVARAGVVYASDAAITDRVRVVYAVPSGRAPHIRYPLACLRGRGDAAQARALAAFLSGERAQAVLARYGFEPPDGG